jgi:lysophospholipase L1-like esterase
MATSPKRLRPPDRRHAGVLVAALVAVAALLAASSAHATAAAKPRVTVIGDSIMASFDYVPAARRALGRGFDLRANHAVCRRLVAQSCPYNGSTPTTALDIVRAWGRTLGPVVVVNVGYNDWSAVYDVDRVMRALRAAGVRRVVWVTLREAGGNASVYASTNARIRAADRRWTSLVVADWNAYSSRRPWFRSDGLHLTPTGAMAMSRLLRPLVVAGASR